jgi:uncharacterized phage protein gp47/JayE
MAFQIPTYEQTRDRYLQAVINQKPDAAIGPDSDHYVRASAQAAVMEGVYSHQAWVYRQAFADLADSDNMEKQANQAGLSRKSASVAGGNIRFSGTAGSPISSGQQVVTSQGLVFATTVAAVVGVGGTVDVTATAVAAGASGNQANNTPATVSSPPSGIAAAATILTMTSGADVESDDSLLNRLLLERSAEAQGGNLIDYKRWALSVPGVDHVFVLPVRRGNGTVDVLPMPASGMPSAPLLAAVQAVLDDKRPVGMLPGFGVLALAPTSVAVNVTAVLVLKSGVTLASIHDQLEDAIANVFAALEPGSTLVRYQLIKALLNVPGVTDVTLSAPAANVTSSVTSSALELLVLGTLSLST